MDDTDIMSTDETNIHRYAKNVLLGAEPSKNGRWW